MKTVIYLDILLLTNFVIALALLGGCSLLAGAECRVWRLLLAAALAAAGCLILLAPPLPLACQAAYQAGLAAAIVRVAFAWQGARVFLRQALWYFGLNLALAGLVVLAAFRGSSMVQTNNLACYYAISPLLLFGCVAGVYLALRVAALCFGRPAAQRLWPVMLQGAGWSAQLAACYDTGFSASDPLTGRPTLLAYYAPLRPSLPPPLQAYLDAALPPGQGGAVPVPPPGWGIHLVQCRTVAGQALLPAVPLAQLTVQGSGRRGRLQKVTLIFAPGCPEDRRCAALLGPELMERIQWRKNDAYHSDQTPVGHAAQP